jgi:A/G-specific adenine glycosylase
MQSVNSNALLRWYETNARSLPWRSQPRNPYHVLVSEFMLQQTQVERVVSYFTAFIARFPDLQRLAAASEEEVLSAWSGLGYYRRARSLHRLAQEVAAGSGLPATATELQRLPGIGPYTAAAVASLAFAEAVPVLDGNVMRVGARVMTMEVDPRSAEGRRRLESWVLELMEGAPPGAINEALMELGATVCTPVEPICGECPFERRCRARADGAQEAFPRPRRRRASVAVRWVAACCFNREGRWLLRRVEDGPILRGLWLPPLAELEASGDPARMAAGLVPGLKWAEGETGSPVRHTITHRRIEVVPVRFAAEGLASLGEDWRWADPLDPGVPTSSLLAKLVGRPDEGPP